MGLKLFERAVRDKEKMDKLFGVPAAKTLSNIGGNRDGCASHLRSQSILLILRQAMHKYVGFGHQIHRFLPHYEILKTFNFLLEGTVVIVILRVAVHYSLPTLLELRFDGLS